MANFASLLFFHCRYFKLYRRRILALPNQIQRLSDTVPDLKYKPCLASLVKCSSYVNQFQNHAPVQSLQFSVKIQDLRLPQLLKEKNIHEGLIINAFQKFFRAFYVYRHQRGFKETLDFYLKSPIFIEFFELIEKNLNKFSSSSLVALYDLHNLNTPKTDALLQKVFTLLGETFITFSFIERLNIYTATVQKFPSKNECKTIIGICEEYFNNHFEDDLEYEKFSCELIDLLEAQELPLFIRKMMAEKLTDDVLNMTYDKKSIIFFIIVIGRNFHLLKKKSFLKLMDFSLSFLPIAVQLKAVFPVYSKVVVQDDSYFCQDIVDKMLETLFRCHPVKLISASQNVFKLGCLDERLVEAVTEWTLENASMESEWYLFFSVASIFTHISAQETLPESVFKKCQEILQNYKIFTNLRMQSRKSRVEMSCEDLSCVWITFLTYLGCDTRELLNEFFTVLKPNLIYMKSLRKLLLLHHLAKTCFPSGYESLNKQFIDKVINSEFRELQDKNLEECFDKDCVIRNCISSDQHFLHFLVVLGPDKKPLNLSKYKKKQLARPSNMYLNISDIHIPPESKLVAFQKYVYSYSNEFRNVAKKTGFYKMYMKAFKNAGCEIVLLPPSFFYLQLEGKKEFINKQINEIFEVTEKSEGIIGEF